MVRSIFALCLLLISHSALALSKVEASVNKNPVLTNEFFYLTITADDSVDKNKLDTSALLKDFVVGPTSVSTDSRYVNGVFSRKDSWHIELMARNPGEYQIPAFTIDGISSAPFTLKVVASNNSQAQAENAFIKTELTPSSLYVQQAGIYTVKLYLGVDLVDGSLTPPTLAEASISQMGQDSEGQEVIDGRRYRVIERNYLIQPQKSGTYELQAPTLNAKARKNYRTIGVSATAPDQLLDIKPIPAQQSGSWLPSELVDLSEQWQGLEDEVQVGTPITRTLTLTALNVTKEQLPDVPNEEVDDVRSYPDQTERTHLVRNGRLIAQTKTSVAYVPQRPGTYVLPEVNVPWFNTVTGRTQIAKVPAKTITVIGDAVSDTVKPTLDNDAKALAQPAVSTDESTSIAWYLVLPGYILWLVTLFMWWLSRKDKTTSKAQDNTQPPPVQGIKNIVIAIKNEDAKGLYHAIDTYAKANHGSIDAWLEYWSKEAADEFAKLRKSLYSPANGVAINYPLIGQAASRKIPTKDNQSKLDSLY
ncbi:BatD family protein [Pseudoalteromonas sp. SSDWG2]|uniref:BatD family protein n=1 Tax=Pseudoalteromonas sp. SSDWG2 TaxID=3139391 RepID=UPI003BAB0AB2